MFESVTADLLRGDGSCGKDVTLMRVCLACKKFFGICQNRIDVNARIQFSQQNVALYQDKYCLLALPVSGHKVILDRFSKTLRGLV